VFYKMGTIRLATGGAFAGGGGYAGRRRLRGAGKFIAAAAAVA
jgi:hypothetical protein